MRWENLSGTKPRDRHSDRRTTALAAIAVMLLVAPSARAGMVELDIDTSLSSLGFTQRIWDPALGPSYMSIPFEFGDYQYTPGPWTNPSNVTSAWGKVYADWNPGVSLQFSSLSAVNYNISGIALPSRDNFGNINTNPLQPGPTQIALEMTNPTLDFLQENPPGSVYGFANIHDLVQTFGSVNMSTGVTSTVIQPILPNIGGNNYIAAPSGANAQSLLAISGFEDLLGLVTDILTLYDGAAGGTPFPSPFAGNVATFDGVTLTLPLTFSFTYGDPGDTIYEINTFGTLVAHVVVPEPSSMIMLGCGVAGLLSYGWRARKRRNLVA
jgi:hypothetical protein